MKVSFDERAIKIDGQRKLLIAGAMHYPRSTPGMWDDLMAKSRRAGLNTIETYVFWNLHERERNVLDFSGSLDLARFCRCAQSHGLHVMLRVGPYLAAETNFGGLAPWLREIPGLRTRTYNEPFMREMERWLRLLTEYVRPLLAPQGGPVVLMQLENEYNLVARNYGEEGQRYLRWVVELGESLRLGVPLTQCVGGADGAIETINGFHAHTQIDKHFREHPTMPALWTECYPGWYDNFGYANHHRDVREHAWAVARFFAAGGSMVNYYMWHGGTNFGRQSMHLQSTSYDWSAPLDEYGLETTRYHHLSRLHHVLMEHESSLLTRPRALPERMSDDRIVYHYGDLRFECDDGAKRVTIHDGATVCFDSARLRKITYRAMTPARQSLRDVQTWREPIGPLGAAVARDPVEQLSLTHDRTDYCWYCADITATTTRNTLTLDRCADVIHVFIDGQLIASSPTPPCEENRGPTDGDGFRQSFDVRLRPGKHKLAILACALGLIKGDWVIGNRNMVEERKGLWGLVTLNGAPARNWRMHPFLQGELHRRFDPRIPLAWASSRSCGPVTWVRARFARPKGDEPVALDLSPMTKGMAWVNGHCLGRYWLIEQHPHDYDWLSGLVTDAPRPGPTQRYYHVPRDWLGDDNTLVLLEELSGAPDQIRVCRRTLARRGDAIAPIRARASQPTDAAVSLAVN